MQNGSETTEMTGGTDIASSPVIALPAESAAHSRPAENSQHLRMNSDTTGTSTRHIVYVIDQLCQLGGAERVLLEIVRRLPPERFRCSVFVFQLNSDLPALKNLPISVQVLPLKRTYDLNAAKMALRLRKFIRQENVSIVHTFFETSDLWAAPIAKWSGCPVVISSRRDMGILRTRKHHLAYPVVNRMFDCVLAVSDEVRSFCINHDQLPPSRVETLYNGVDLAELDAKAAEGKARKQLDIQGDVPVITTVANIRSIKGIDVLISAAKRVCQEFPAATFLVVGRVLETETMAKLQAQVESLKLENNFRFVGPHTNPFSILKASNIFCLPSRSEGFSNALIEAMGCGLPCVATRVGGNAEALTEEKNGYVVDSEDHATMADRILKLLRDPDLAQRMGRDGRKTVEMRFSIDAMMSRLMHLYDKVLAGKNA
jgi:glycosyltransferase involved in cell wall biosynthesis